MIVKLYPNEQYNIHDRVYNEIYTSIHSKKVETIQLGKALCHKDYSTASWLCVYLAFAQQMSGINIINIYAKTIFMDI